jgi:hypothetical protein
MREVSTGQFPGLISITWTVVVILLGDGAVIEAG